MGKNKIIPINKEKLMNKNDFIVSKTDTRGIITYCNEIFMTMAEYDENELLGKNHNIIRHPDMPRAAFKLVWDTIKSGKEIFAYVKNLSKSGSFYWVFAHITPDFDQNGTIVGYTSVRRAPNRAAIDAVEPLYKQMLQAEKIGGMSSGEKVLLDFLEKNNIGYEELVLSLQGDM